MNNLRAVRRQCFHISLKALGEQFGRKLGLPQLQSFHFFSSDKYPMF